MNTVRHLTLFNIRRFLNWLRIDVNLLQCKQSMCNNDIKRLELKIKQLEADIRFLQNKF